MNWLVTAVAGMACLYAQGALASDMTAAFSSNAAHPSYSEIGLASWYGQEFHGRPTADGEIFDMRALSAAHRTMPLPSYARVTNLANGRSIVVRVNDRGPYVAGRLLDVSAEVAIVLDFGHYGVTRVKVDYVGKAPPAGTDGAALLASLRGAGVPTAAAAIAAVVRAAPVPDPSPALAFASTDANITTVTRVAVDSPKVEKPPHSPYGGLVSLQYFAQTP